MSSSEDGGGNNSNAEEEHDDERVSTYLPTSQQTRSAVGDLIVLLFRLRFSCTTIELFHDFFI